MEAQNKSEDLLVGPDETHSSSRVKCCECNVVS